MNIELKIGNDVILDGSIPDYDRQALIDLARQIHDRRKLYNAEHVRYPGKSWWDNSSNVR